MSTNNEDLMSPDASPGEQSKRAGVRRVNNVPLYIASGGLAVFLLIMLLVASDRAAKQSEPAQASQQATQLGERASSAASELGHVLTGPLRQGAEPANE